MRHHLLIDDNAALAENLAEIIRDTGDEVTTVTDATKAIELVRQQRYDTLITDMRMPLMSGAHLVHAVRSIDPGLPALVITAYTGDEDLAAARSEGVLAILPKPVPINRLLTLLGTARRDGLVAIIEDDESLADNLSEVMRDAGFSAVTATSVLETERLGPVKPFAALVDLRVPGGPDGEAYRRLDALFPGLPKLVITAFAPDVSMLQPTKVYSKPFDTGELLQDLKTLYTERCLS